MSTASDLNQRLIEEFGKLEQLCNQIYNTKHGVTSYINDMERYVNININGWSDNYKKLKQIRYKRNKLSHGETSFGEQFTTEEDIAFAVNFQNQILNHTDPLSLRRRHLRKKSSKKQKRKLRPYSGCVIFLIIIAFLIFIAINSIFNK